MPRRIRLAADERRQRILDSARRLFIERGFESVRMGDVALAAGVSRPLVYAHFASTAQMLDDLLSQALADLSARLAPALAAVEADPANAVRAVVRILVESDALLAVLFSGGSPAFHRQRRRRLKESLGPLLLPYLPKTRLGPYDLDILFVLFEGIGLFIRAERSEDPEAVIENLASFIEHGLAPAPGPGSAPGATEVAPPAPMERGPYSMPLQTT
jgi:AcrR family transcriptional regulator